MMSFKEKGTARVINLLSCRVLFLLIALVPIVGLSGTPGDQLSGFVSPDAHQGVAVDDKYVYAVNSRSITKHDKFTGKKITEWKSSKDEGIVHLDSGVVHEGRLYCAHSNYPGLPMTGSVEVFDTGNLLHVASHSFGIEFGSCTWVDRHGGHWWAAFAHYDKKSGYPDKDNKWTQVVKFDDMWKKLEAWVLPEKVLEKFGKYSNSGGSWGPDGFLYLTGHDLAEVYKVKLPDCGSRLQLVETIPFPNRGQGIAFDRSRPGVLYGIHRDKKSVVSKRITGD